MTDYAGDFHVTAPLTHTYIYGFSGDLRSICSQLSNFSQRDRAKGEKFGEFEGAHRLYRNVQTSVTAYLISLLGECVLI